MKILRWAMVLTVMSCSRPPTEGVHPPPMPTSVTRVPPESSAQVFPFFPRKTLPPVRLEVLDSDTADSGVAIPEFRGVVRALPQNVRDAMTGVSWREGCPVSLDALVLLDFFYWGFDDKPHLGRMVLTQAVGASAMDVFKQLYALRFPLEHVALVEEYGGNDERSMEANNSSAFNCRPITGGNTYSRHAYGQAMDLNPLINPYVRGSTVLPPGGNAYLSRDPSVKGLITANSPVVVAFKNAGWIWGGDWSGIKDYQHFEKP